MGREAEPAWEVLLSRASVWAIRTSRVVERAGGVAWVRVWGLAWAVGRAVGVAFGLPWAGPA